MALDGDTALVGARYANISGHARQGAVYVFVRSGTAWGLQQTLTAADGAAGDHLGWSVALDGDTALVGAPDLDISERASQGAVYVFVRSGTTADGAAGDWFGWSVAISGNTALVGAYLHDVGANDGQGTAYVFTRNGTA